MTTYCIVQNGKVMYGPANWDGIAFGQNASLLLGESITWGNQHPPSAPIILDQGISILPVDIVPTDFDPMTQYSAEGPAVVSDKAVTITYTAQPLPPDQVAANQAPPAPPPLSLDQQTALALLSSGVIQPTAYDADTQAQLNAAATAAQISVPVSLFNAMKAQ